MNTCHKKYTWILGQRKNCQFNLETWNLFIGQFVHPVGGGGIGGRGKSLLYPAAGFTLLGNMKIWCNIHVIIYPLPILSEYHGRRRTTILFKMEQLFLEHDLGVQRTPGKRTAL